MHTLDRTKQQTWLQQVPHVIFVGIPTLATEVDFSEHTRLCKLRCKDDYDSLPTKVWLALRFMKDTFDPEYLFKVDDDVILRPALLPKYVRELQPYDYAGNVCTHIRFAAFCGGPLYYLSRKAIECLYFYMQYSFSTIEDLNVGYSLAEHGIYPTAFKLFAHPTAEEFEENPDLLALHDNERKYFKNRSKQYEVVPVIPAKGNPQQHKHEYAEKIKKERAAFDARTRQLKSKFSLIV
jgi:hypothetical protein